MNAVRVKNLTKKYKEHTAVDGISFDVVNENLLSRASDTMYILQL